jgi:anti-sigma B factor antagonist
VVSVCAVLESEVALSSIEKPLEPVLRCEVRPHRESVILALIGELDLDTVAIVETELRDLHERGFDSLLVDLAELSFIDSTGLRLLLTWTRAAANGGPQFGLVSGVSTQVGRVLDIAGVTEHLEFVPR